MIPKKKRVKGVRQVEGQRGGVRDGTGVYQLTFGGQHFLAELPQEDLGAGEQQAEHPDEKQLQQNRATVFHAPRLQLRRGGGSVEPVDAQSAEGEGGDAQRYHLEN